ncbi:gibberellin-regulated protein 12-like [Pyrus x bretschneideri]|uniref:gibberellin-regulated protein 12-like n=1 Tax=Pyrus x bretschneideri TaxID=225117 RepID=UPI00202FD05E|nr:gibberellin-regulated protein 12-like [Pyrus x bretschneideri]
MARLSWILTALFVILALMTFAIDISLAQENQNAGATVHPLTTGGHGSPPSKAIDCPKACKLRCSPTLHKKPCMFFCNKWCAKCLCVPSGTHGHKENCPCYNYWKAKEAGRPKCKCP